MQQLTDAPTKCASIAALIKKCLWPSPCHPALAMNAVELFDTLVSIYNTQGKSYLLHSAEGKLHMVYYGQQVQNKACWMPELFLSCGIVFRKNTVIGAVDIVAKPWP
eukprot:5622991-Ditylum_brightwellii.AAC.1